MSALSYRLTVSILFATLVAVPVSAQNLLVNPDFSSGTDGWQLGDGTRVVRFPETGGIDLATTHPASGGIFQCVATPQQQIDTILNASFSATLSSGAAGALRGILTSFATSDCSGDALNSIVMEPPLDIGTSPFGVAGRIAGSLTIDSIVSSVRLWALAAQPMPPNEFEYNIEDPVLEVSGTEPGPSPDLVARLPTSFILRSGDTPRTLLAIQNFGDAPSSGPWSVTITAPEGFKLSCADIGLECSGNGTAQLVISGTEILPPDPTMFTYLRFDFATAGVPPGDYEFMITVSGGDDGNTSNNSSQSGTISLSPPRQSMRAADSQTQSTQGRGHADSGGNE